MPEPIIDLPAIELPAVQAKPVPTRLGRINDLSPLTDASKSDQPLSVPLYVGLQTPTGPVEIEVLVDADPAAPEVQAFVGYLVSLGLPKLQAKLGGAQ